MSTPVNCRTCGRPVSDGDRFCPRCGTDQRSAVGDPPQQASGSTWDAILERIRYAAAPKYQVVRVLGYGGMAAVYLAREPKLGREVAIKVMSPTLMVDPKLVERFEQEARTIAQLSHPNIVTVYEVDERDGIHFFAMTYVAGRTLGQIMTEPSQPLPLPVVRSWLAQIGAALAYAHRAGVVHRDIKPANILLDRDGNVLVTDFGIAKVADEPSLTRTGQIIGTPSYISPEQCLSQPVTGASDQYALGAVAYHMVTGQPPFTGPTLAVLQAHVTQRAKPIQNLRPDCPDDLRMAIERMLAKDPDERFPDVAAALDAFNATPPGLNDPVRIQLATLAAHVARVVFVAAPESLAEGMRRVLEAVPQDATGRVLEGRPVRWSSSDRSIAQVGPDGKLVALQPGRVRITAACEGVSSAFDLLITPDPVEAVELVLPRPWISAGDALMASALVRGGRGAPPEERAVLWTSSDPAIARISATGVIEALGPGTVTISAATGARTATAVLTVVDGRITVTPPPTGVGAAATPSGAARVHPTHGVGSAPATPPRATENIPTATRVVSPAPPAGATGPGLPSPVPPPAPLPPEPPPVLPPTQHEAPALPPATRWPRSRVLQGAGAAILVLVVAGVTAYGLRDPSPVPPLPDAPGAAGDPGTRPLDFATTGGDPVLGAGSGGSNVLPADSATTPGAPSSPAVAISPPAPSTAQTPPAAPATPATQTAATPPSTPVPAPGAARGTNPPATTATPPAPAQPQTPPPAAPPPAPALSQLDVARNEITAIVERLQRALAARDLAEVRRIYPAASGNEAWWQFLADGQPARVQAQFFQQSPITPINDAALVIYSSRFVRFDAAGNITAERPFVLQLQFSREAAGWRLATIR